LNTEYFIAKRIAKGGKKSNRFSRPIILFATIGIALGMIVMILSISIVTGFQTEIKNKVVGFGSHIQITNGGYSLSFESSPMHRNQTFLEQLNAIPQVKHIQSYAIKPGIIRSNGDTIVKEGKEIIYRDILGTIVKGVGPEYDWSFFVDKIESGGKIPNFNSNQKNDSILVSRYVADKLKLKLHDKVSTYFIKDTGPKERKFFISGIYDTGLQDFDKRFIFSDIRQVQELNFWGIETGLKMSHQCANGGYVIEATSFSNGNNIMFSWNNGSFTDQDKIIIYPTEDTVIQLIAAGFTPVDYSDNQIMIIEPDTSFLHIKINSQSDSCLCNGVIEANDYNGLNDTTLKYDFNNGDVITIFSSPEGSRGNYVGGFEIILKDFESIAKASSIVRGEMLGMYSVSTIDELHQDIFGWLGMLDANVYIIIILMIIVAVINMTAALLILILERTNMIGVLKALGATNWSVQKLFLYNGGILILKGLLIGNSVAFLLIFIQNQFGFIQLNQATYFVKEVPMYFTPTYVIALNLFTLIVCVLVLMLPALFVLRITPVKAIRFD
jgi:lipoprotein-releasing system permease protein